jgi:3-oxoadipate enol-lactonase
MQTPIIFLHGFPFNGSCWDPQVVHFKNKTAVFNPDLRGHRDGPGTEKNENLGPWMIAHFVEDLIKLLDEKNIKKVSLCGLSMGGYIALHFISNFPERVQNLILCDTQAGADNNESKSQRYETIKNIQKNGLTDLAKSFSKKAISESTLKNNPQIQNQLESMILKNKAECIALVVGALAARNDFASSLSNIQCPTLIIVGSDDNITSPEINKELAMKIPGARFETISQAGHLSNLEKPEIFNSILEDFLMTCDQTS